MKEKGKQQLRKAGNGNVTFFSFFFFCEDEEEGRRKDRGCWAVKPSRSNGNGLFFFFILKEGEARQPLSFAPTWACGWYAYGMKLWQAREGVHWAEENRGAWKAESERKAVLCPFFFLFELSQLHLGILISICVMCPYSSDCQATRPFSLLPSCSFFFCRTPFDL